MSALGHKRTFAVQYGDVRFTPKSGHWVPFANVLAPYSWLAARPSSSGPTYFAQLLVEREIAR